MSFIIYPSTTLSSTDPVTIQPTQQISDCTMIAINNYSTFGLGLVLPGNVQDFLLPQQGKYFASDDFYGDNIKIFPVQMLQQAFSGISQTLSIIGYTKGERTPPAGTSYQLGTVVFVANAINTVGGVANSVINDGNAPGTDIMEATVNSESSSSVELTNDAQLILGKSTAPVHYGSVTIRTSAGDVTISTGGVVTIPGSILANLITAITGNDIGFHVASGHRVVDTINSVDIAQTASTGFKVLTGTLSLPQGLGISAWSWFGDYTSDTTPTAYNHSLGVTPDVVICQPNGGVTTSRTINVNFATLTSTQFTATCNAAGFTFRGIAMKF